MGKGAVYAFLGPFATNDKMAQKREGVDKMLSHFFTPSFLYKELSAIHLKPRCGAHRGRLRSISLLLQGEVPSWRGGGSFGAGRNYIYAIIWREK